MNFVTIREKSHILFEKMWEIYDYSFPFEEKRNMQEHECVMRDADFFSDVILSGGEVVGIMFYWQMPKYAYIEHFAISKDMRGRGIGSAALDEFLKLHPSAVLEIEPPCDVITEKRKAFYDKAGFKFYDLDYMHPSFGKRFPPYKLSLMSFGFDITKSDAKELESKLDDICNRV